MSLNVARKIVNAVSSISSAQGYKKDELKAKYTRLLTLEPVDNLAEDFIHYHNGVQQISNIIEEQLEPEVTVSEIRRVLSGLK